MKKRLAVLLLCALTLLSACGKKHAEPAGSGSAEETVEAQTKKDAKKTGKSTKNTKETAAPNSTAAPSNGKSGSGASGGKTAPAATPTPKIETWEELEDYQKQMTELIAVNPVGNWIDRNTGAAMVIDEEFHGSILLAQPDGTNVFWVFTGVYDLERAVLTCTDCKKLVQSASGMKTVYENGVGTFTAKDDGLVWVDETGNQTMTFERDT